MKISNWLLLAGLVVPVWACSSSSDDAGTAGKAGSANGGSAGGTVGGNGGGTVGGNGGGVVGGNGGGTVGGNGGGTVGGNGGAGGATGGAGGGTASACEIAADNACGDCVGAKCETECVSLQDDAQWQSFGACAQACNWTSACIDDCSQQFPAAGAKFAAFNSCGSAQCATECGGGGDACGLSFGAGREACDTCFQGKCDTECVDLQNDPVFQALMDCYDPCRAMPAGAERDACFDTCQKDHPLLNSGLDECIAVECSAECEYGFDCPALTGDPASACSTCSVTNCNAECLACGQQPHCFGLYLCIFSGCAAGDTTCQEACMTKHAAGVDALLGFIGNDQSCLNAKCKTQCFSP